MNDSAISWHEKIANRFDQRYVDGKLFRDRFRVWTRFLKTYCDSRVDRVLDLGCGAGNHSLQLAQWCDRIVCVDGSAEMARICDDRLASALHGNYEVVVSDIDEYCVSSEELFDIICCSSVLEYIDDMDKTLSLINDRLRNCGTFVFSIPNSESVYRKIERIVYKFTGRPSYYRYVRNVLSLAEVKAAVSRSGFELLEFEYITNAPYVGRVLALLGPKRSKSLILVACKRTDNSQ